ncbi:hypothetical protein [Mycolicibacterium elephantis]|uniref:Uncharacterized protein n=1 Tax=Mycolicibacterium elephantis DSM 44368 TaxID=1335622 RepID=A0A439DV07_9MYCO|nr:hypothetical protein [Mycolicibacterium elephantis]RWA20873.1 hypothetical protein MELE44368_02670 [Mycolicibacterium elephantis DSM 44368]
MLTAINALGVNQRDHTARLIGVETRLTGVETRLTSVENELADFRQEARARFRSVDEHLAEIKDLIVGRNS